MVFSSALNYAQMNTPHGITARRKQYISSIVTIAVRQSVSNIPKESMSLSAVLNAVSNTGIEITPVWTRRVYVSKDVRSSLCIL